MSFKQFVYPMAMMIIFKSRDGNEKNIYILTASKSLLIVLR